MTTKQMFLAKLYPLVKFFSKLLKKDTPCTVEKAPAKVSFYQLHSHLNNGSDYPFEKLKNKKVMIVNTASDCGFTAQYGELEKLYEAKKDKLEILAFPANDFKKQENKDDHAIAEFCKQNYGVTFPLMRKSKVVVHSTQNSVYDWLTDKEKNGWNSQQPTWNFCKYLVDENGNLSHFFEPYESPLSSTILAAIEE